MAQVVTTARLAAPLALLTRMVSLNLAFVHGWVLVSDIKVLAPTWT